MKKNTAFSLLIILSVAALFRFSFLDKPEGLWNDEYTSWYISSLSDWQIFFAKVFQNCHTPLYYLYLKLWMLLFNDNDLTLRLSSVIPSLLSIPVMYFAGKEIKDKNTGLFAAGFTAISSFCIYFAQEARLYSLLFLISSLTVLYFIKATKEANKINIIFFFLFQSLLCALHTLGIVYIFFMTGFYILYGKKEGIDLKKYLPALCILVCALMILSPLLFKIAFSKTLYQFWSSFSLSKVFFNFTDYFSPVQMNIINTPKSIIKTFINNGHLNLKFIIFAVIPSIIALIGICRGLKEKNNYLNILTAISGLFYLCAVLFSLSGKMILVTKYTSEIYPSLILTFSLGILSIKKAPLKKLLISVFVFIHLFYLILAPDAAYKQERNE